MAKKGKHRFNEGFGIRAFVPNLRRQTQEVIATHPQLSEEKREAINELVVALEEAGELLTLEEIRARVEYWKEEEFKKCAASIKEGKPLGREWDRFKKTYWPNIERLL